MWGTEDNFSHNSPKVALKSTFAFLHNLRGCETFQPMTFDYESHKFKSTNKSVYDKNKENVSSYKMYSLYLSWCFMILKTCI